MSIKDRNEAALRSAGWHSRGYLPHFDGRAQPQFITLHLADSIPRAVIERWQRELRMENSLSQRVLLQNRIEKYLDQGYGECVFNDKRIANMAQESLLRFDGSRYKLHSWVVMPNHLHFLMTRAEDMELCDILQTFKFTSRMKQTSCSRERVSYGCQSITTDTFEMQNIFARRCTI